MLLREIKTDIFAVGAVDWDRRLFDELIPLPEGTTYNSYLIRGSNKTALIDTVDPEKKDILLDNLKRLNVKKIDYIISSHGEQDHSGTLPDILAIYPEAKVVTNEKCKNMLMDLLLIDPDKFITITDRETLSLGNKMLEFVYAPWVHWPETILTYLKEDKILFPCDLFGAHLAESELFANDETKVHESAKRYYAEIMMPFRNNIKNHLKKLKEYDIEMIAPSHGPVYNRPQFIIDAYNEWVNDEVKNEVIIPYVSMHGSVEKMVEHLVDQLIERGITVKPFNLTVTDIGELAMSLVDAATIVVAAPTVLAGPHPSAVYAVYLVNALRPKVKFASVVGSYGWGGKMLEQISGMTSNLKTEMIEPVMIKGYPKADDFAALNKLADSIKLKHKELGIASR
jgi:flavorubredoxin